MAQYRLGYFYPVHDWRECVFGSHDFEASFDAEAKEIMYRFIAHGPTRVLASGYLRYIRPAYCLNRETGRQVKPPWARIHALPRNENGNHIYVSRCYR